MQGENCQVPEPPSDHQHNYTYHHGFSRHVIDIYEGGRLTLLLTAFVSDRWSKKSWLASDKIVYE